MLGKFIVIYGVNNLGKTTQAKRVVKELRRRGKTAEYMKFGRYDVSPSGPILDRYLRQGNPDRLSYREFQLVHVLNRTQVMPAMLATLENGTWIVAEDYKYSGIVWGMASGVPRAFLEDINSHLMAEDITILLDGERFIESIEEQHKHEQDRALVEHARTVYKEIARESGWQVINANQTEDAVFADTWKYIEQEAGVKL